jgi:hypothetical protein
MGHAACTKARQGIEYARESPAVVVSINAGVAQLVEHQPSKLNVARSSRVARFEHNILAER